MQQSCQLDKATQLALSEQFEASQNHTRQEAVAKRPKYLEQIAPLKQI